MARPLPRRRSPKARLLLSLLEDRITPNTFPVTNANDSGAGSFRDAITQANANPGLDTITFDGTTFGTPKTISLLTALPQLTDSVKITGPGSGLVTVQPSASASTSFALIPINGTNLTLNLSGMTLTHSKASGISVGSNDSITLTDVAAVNNSGAGGLLIRSNSSVTGQSCVLANNTGYGVYGGQNSSISLQNCLIASNAFGGIAQVYGSLSLEACTISGNQGHYSGGYGGGIFALQANSFLLSDSTVSGNYAPRDGGGILLQPANGASARTFTIRNTTVIGNTAAGSGGGIEWNSAIGSLAIQNSTIVGNTASDSDSYPLGVGGGIDVAGSPSAATLILQSTVVAGNAGLFRLNPESDISVESYPSSPITTLTADHSLLGVADNVTLSSNSANNLTGTLAAPLDPKLALMTNNGGATFTAAPLRGSPLIDAGSNPANLTSDQRGLPRVAGSAPDIGAVERTPGTPDAVAGPLPSVTSPGGTSYQFTVSYSDDAAIMASTLDGNDILVTGPYGYSQSASLVGVSPPGNGSPLTATYSITPPGGSWQLSGDGIYTLTLQANQVSDTGGRPVPAGPLGAFTVAVPLNVTVTSLADSGPGTFRQALLDTKAVAAANTIRFDPPLFAGGPATISVTGGLGVSNNITIVGPGSALLTIRAAGTNYGVLGFGGFPGASVNLSGVTISGGNGPGLGFASDNAVLTDVVVSGNAYSGILARYGSLTLRNCTITGNSGSTATGISVFYGGGIYAVDNGLLIDGCTISSNSLPRGAGGGVFVEGIPGPGGVTIRNSTIANNTAPKGGGIDCEQYSGPVLIQNSTIVGNTVTGNGGGIAENNGPWPSVILQSTIVAKNLRPGVPTSTETDIWGANSTPGTVRADHSLIGVADSTFTFVPGSAFNYTGTVANPLNPKLAPLGNYGGPTQTAPPLAGSPALNAGSNPANLTTDQRGMPRSIGPAPDIGAYEYQPITVAGVQVNDGSAQRSEVRSIAVTFSGPVSFAGGNAAAAFKLTHVQTGNDVILSAMVSTNPLGQTVVTLTFSGAETDAFSASNGAAVSLADGRYQLTVLGSAVADASLGWALDGNGDGTPGGNYTSPADAYLGNGLHLYRIFGDANGDGVIDSTDLGQFRSTFNANTSSPIYLAFLDANNDGVIDSTDLGQFRVRFNLNVF